MTGSEEGRCLKFWTITCSRNVTLASHARGIIEVSSSVCSFRLSRSLLLPAFERFTRVPLKADLQSLFCVWGLPDRFQARRYFVTLALPRNTTHRSLQDGTRGIFGGRRNTCVTWSRSMRITLSRRAQLTRDAGHNGRRLVPGRQRHTLTVAGLRGAVEDAASTDPAAAHAAVTTRGATLHTTSWKVQADTNIQCLSLIMFTTYKYIK